MTTINHHPVNRFNGNSTASRLSIQCINCGEIGHVYKMCKQPITSYGIMCFRKNEEGKRDDDSSSSSSNNDALEVLLVQRKDTFAYVEFMRGMYDIKDTLYISFLLMNMTRKEKASLLSKEFNENWKGLWGCKPRHSTAFIREYHDSSAKFEHIKDNIKMLMQHDLDIIRSDPGLEWGVPKGRRCINESDVACAIREFHEETGISLRDIELHDHVDPLEEQFTGTNGVVYRYKYYLANLSNLKHDIEVSIALAAMEINDAKWFDVRDAKQHFLEGGQCQRAKVLGDAVDIIRKEWHY